MKAWFLILLFFVQTAARGAGFTVDDSGPSIFFGDGPARSDFDYRAWSGNRAPFRYGFDRKRWDAIAPVPTSERRLSRKEAEWLLARYQKPGGFVPGRDLRILKAILQSGVKNDHPVLVAGALQNVLATSPGAYDGILRELRVLRRLEPVHGRNPFRTREEEKVVVKASVKYADAQRSRLLPDSDPLRGSRLSDWTNLMPLASALNQLEESERSWREDEIMESMVFRAARRELDGVFPSIIAKFAEQVVAPLYGEKADDMTNVEIVRHHDRLTPFIFGTQPIRGLAEKKNEYGFYAARLADIPISRGMAPSTHNIAWTHGDKKFTAKIDLKIVKGTPSGKIIPDDPAPRYDELWRPQKPGDPKALTGLIAFGSNLADDAPDVVKSLTAYFHSRGFEVDAEREALKDTKTFLRDQIISGETSWFDKEAHSDGDDANIFAVARHSDVVTFRLNRRGKREVVRIIVPRDGANEPEDVITNREFGIWMRARARRQKKQLLFLNASCWSVDKGQNEIPEAHTRYLAEILTSTITDYFRNRLDNAIHIFLDGIRKGKTYAEIRKALEADKDYVESTADKLLFPDQPEYLERVLHHFAPLRIRIDMRDEKGRHYDGKAITDPCANLKKL